MKKIWTLVSLFSLLLWAGGDHDLQSKIARLQQVPRSERFKLMNEIKRELATMNARQRSIALGKLRASLHSGGEHGGKGVQHEKQMRMQVEKQEHMQQSMPHMQQHKQQMPQMQMPHLEKTQPLPLPKQSPGVPHGR